MLEEERDREKAFRETERECVFVLERENKLLGERQTHVIKEHLIPD